MKIRIQNMSVTAMILSVCTCSSRAQTQTPDLKAVPDGKGWKGSIAAAKLVEKDGAAAIEFDKPGQNVVWLDGFEFSTGTLEFDAKGKSAPPQSCFVGVAFRTVDDKTYDAVYFRPFNFRAADPERKSHAVQYVSEPQWPWQRLRQEKPGQFEKPIESAPDGERTQRPPRWLRWTVVQWLRRHRQSEDHAEQMTNDETGITKEIPNLNDKGRAVERAGTLWTFVLRHSFDIRHSDFVIVHNLLTSVDTKL